MKGNQRSNALLVELLIVVMFFMLSATILLQVFSRARTMDIRAELEADAVAQAQDLADRLWAADDPDALLRSLGFTQAGGVWEQREPEGPDARVTVAEEALPGGVLRRQEIRMLDGDGGVLLTLPCSRYLEVSP